MFLAVHIGAGFHHPKKEREYKKLIKKALKIGKQLLQNKSSGIEVISAVIECLEDSELTNAGVGSNLNLNGEVECDASLMEGKHLHFTSVGAISKVRNPIRLCEQMMKQYQQGNWSLGRIPPLMLSGVPNELISKIYNTPLINSTELITESSLKQYQKHTKQLKIHHNLNEIDEIDFVHCFNINQNDVNVDESQTTQPNDEPNFYDTVGAICIDSDGTIVSGCSSGGISLKLPGRVGEAAMKRLGCYSENTSEHCPIGIGYSCTGMGEHLITLDLGVHVTNYFKHYMENDDNEQFTLNYLTFLDYLEPQLKLMNNCPSIQQFNSVLMGILFIGLDSSNSDLHYAKAFSTPSMGSGYWNGNKDEMKVSIDYNPSYDHTKKDAKWCLIGKKFKI